MNGKFKSLDYESLQKVTMTLFLITLGATFKNSKFVRTTYILYVGYYIHNKFVRIQIIINNETVVYDKFLFVCYNLCGHDRLPKIK